VLTAEKLHIEEDLPTLHPPSVDFRNWHLVGQQSLDRSKAQCLGSSYVITELDYEIELLKPSDGVGVSWV
jgi:hypothetical protein